MGNTWIGRVNCEVARELYSGYGRCAEVLCEGLQETSHLVRAVSVAKAAGVCPYKARLIEVMGAGDLSASRSVFPGKGEAVHEVLAVAAPRLFREYLARGDFAGAVANVDSVVEAVLEELREERVPPLDSSDVNLHAVKSSAGLMLRKFVELVKSLESRDVIDPSRARVRAELELFDYFMHVRGVVDLVLEDVKRRRAVVVEWKTSVGEGGRPTEDELMQGYVYSLMVAHRLGYIADDEKAVLDCKVFPVVIRDRGTTNPYSVSRCFKTASRTFDEENALRRIKIAATHLVLLLTDFRKVDPQWHRNEEKICGENGKVIYRRVPPELTNFGYVLNPQVNKNYPCGKCTLKDACLFYMFSKKEQDEVHRLAWRSRFRVFRVRENALEPYFWITKRGVLRGPLGETGARVDVFDRVWPEGHLAVVLERPVDRDEAARGLPMTVREGKPVTVFLRDVDEVVFSSNFTGVVDHVDFGRGVVRVRVSFEGRFSKMSFFIARDLLSAEPELGRGVVAVEGNVDLTHIELMAIDAFQRSVKRDWKEFLNDVDEDMAKKVAYKYGFKAREKLLRLFSLKYAIR